MSVGHMFVRGAGSRRQPHVSVGLLGADYRVENGRYRFSKIYDGENWNPDVQAPLTQPGVEREGRRLSAGRQRPQRHRRPRESTATSRRRPASRRRSASGRTPTAAVRATCRSCRCASEGAAAQPRPGSKATAAKSISSAAGSSPTFICRTRRTAASPTSTAISSRRSASRASSSTSASTTAVRSPTTSSICSGASRWASSSAAKGRRRSIRRWRSTGPRSW